MYSLRLVAAILILCLLEATRATYPVWYAPRTFGFGPGLGFGGFGGYAPGFGYGGFGYGGYPFLGAGFGVGIGPLGIGGYAGLG